MADDDQKIYEALCMIEVQCIAAKQTSAWQVHWTELPNVMPKVQDDGSHSRCLVLAASKDFFEG